MIQPTRTVNLHGDDPLETYMCASLAYEFKRLQPSDFDAVLLPLQFRLDEVGSSLAMNTIIQGQLDRVDIALNTLVESIASYNPSIPAANKLLAADDDLARGVQSRKIVT